MRNIENFKKNLEILKTLKKTEKNGKIQKKLRIFEIFKK